MKKGKEKEIRGLEVFCMITALAVGVLSVLFLFDFLQNYWFLNFILGLGVLLHVAFLLLYLLRRRHVLAGGSALLAVFYAGCMIYFNFL